MLNWPVMMMSAVISATPGQVAPPAATQATPEEAVRLEDVVVTSRRLRDEAGAFVEELAAPPPNRGLARWRGAVCIGVVNLSESVARPLIDHIATVANAYDVRIGAPGCSPNVVIIFTDDAPGLATALVSREPGAFRVGWSRKLDRGKEALDAFQVSDGPVRWWHISMPVIGATGRRAIRMPGDEGPIYVPGEGRVNNGRPISDQLSKVMIIVDMTKVEGTSLPLLGDYLAMVALAQVDPEGDTGRFDTVLNLFDGHGRAAGLSGWDRAYLSSLYGAHWERVDPYTHASAIVRDLRRAEREGDDVAVVGPTK
ncbi:hypothetical protein [Brevundimonas sp.]|uniref:hypothetical protein n=1 Tax=Brevundimonas sp. TaxID=1871086 RepID=UPI003D6CE4F8